MSSPATLRPAKVNIDYHVVLDGHHYSVPHEARAPASVELRVTTRTRSRSCTGASGSPAICVRRRALRLQHHPRASAGCASGPPRVVTAAPHPLGRNRSGPACAAVIVRILETRPHPEQGYRACLGLLRLSRQ